MKLGVYFEHYIDEEVTKIAKTDTNLALYAMIIITIYLVIFLGNFSPIHCRLSIAVIGIICIVISVTSSFGLGI